jgi:hypothetical protein
LAVFGDDCGGDDDDDGEASLGSFTGFRLRLMVAEVDPMGDVPLVNDCTDDNDDVDVGITTGVDNNGDGNEHVVWLPYRDTTPLHIKSSICCV